MGETAPNAVLEKAVAGYNGGDSPSAVLEKAIAGYCQGYRRMLSITISNTIMMH